MKGLSVVVTMLLFVVAVALSNYLKKTRAVPPESGASTAFENTADSEHSRVPGEMASYVRDTRQYRN